MFKLFNTKSIRSVLNEAQDLNFHHAELVKIMWDFFNSEAVCHDEPYTSLNKRMDLAVANHATIMTGHKLLDIIERYNNPKFDIC